MPATSDAIRALFHRLRQQLDEKGVAARFSAKPDKPLRPRIRPFRSPSSASVASAWRTLARETGCGEAEQAQLADGGTLDQLAAYSRNIENMVGTVKVPVGVVGPLRINGLHASDDYYVPLATTEAALVASYGRGCHVISLAGGCTAAMLSESLTRSPGFAFRTMLEAGLFSEWAVTTSRRAAGGRHDHAAWRADRRDAACRSRPRLSGVPLYDRRRRRGRT